MPVDPSWYNPRKFLPDSIIGQELELTLYSEHSLQKVDAKKFTVKPGWVKWIGPVARIGSLLMTGLAIPLTGPLESDIGEATRFMNAVGGVADKELGGTRGSKESQDQVIWPSGADLRSLQKLLEEVGLAPRYGDMEFVSVPGKGYRWVSKEEAALYKEVMPEL